MSFETIEVYWLTNLAASASESQNITPLPKFAYRIRPSLAGNPDDSLFRTLYPQLVAVVAQIVPSPGYFPDHAAVPGPAHMSTSSFSSHPVVSAPVVDSGAPVSAYMPLLRTRLMSESSVSMTYVLSPAALSLSTSA